MAKQTPLYEQHVACGARMVDFHGWMMPLHYGSQIDEHHAVRQDAGMFDVSHMTIVDLHWRPHPGVPALSAGERRCQTHPARQGAVQRHAECLRRRD
ncbi:hypothetical protein GGER_42050 [Serratia rubidaea]